MSDGEASMEGRWKGAQASELRFWSDERNAGHFTDAYWNWELSHFGFDLTSFVEHSVLEVGSGPRGVIYFLKGSSRQRMGVEPLAGELKKLGYPIHQATSVVGVGEFVPVRGGAVDVVISNNVLDHTLDPLANLREMCRVLAQNGTLLLMINVIPTILGPLAPVLGVFDPPHPHHFTASDIECLLTRTGLSASRKMLRKGAKSRPEMVELLHPSHWKYFFAHYAMSVLYVVATKRESPCA